MNTQSPLPSPEPDYLTVAQGRMIFDRVKLVGEGLEKLKPLLALLDASPQETDQDPILRLIELLECVSNMQISQDERLHDINRKLDWLMANWPNAEA